jgi:hypothetical protein
MRDNKFRYTKFGLVNFLLSLIPIFPILSLFPGMLFAIKVGEAISNCELGYIIYLWTSLALIALLLFRLFKRVTTPETKEAEKQLKRTFRLYSLGIYVLTTPALLILFFGPNNACHGQSDSILGVYFTGPLASIGLLLLGISADIKVRTTAHNNELC